ncbi:MAG: phosphotransferase enzyme family protein, partial [Bdellovibrionota bacterium]
LNHGENTTFRVDAANGQKYMLRVHRDGYHTEAAIGEELSWLDHINSTTDLLVPSPVKSKQGTFLVKASAEGVPVPRFCALFKWVPGKFIFKSTTPKDVFRLGKLIANLHATTKSRAVKHRIYWDAEGLLGTERPKFGPISQPDGVKNSDLKTILSGREEIFEYLSDFESRFPSRQGLIHADLHFGNFLVGKDSLGAIDFDDCGFGFHGYDLSIPIQHLTNLCKSSPRKKFLGLVDALQNGYASAGTWDQHDQEALPYFYTARRILMLGWLQSRSEIPRLKKHLKKSAPTVAQFLKTKWKKFS